MTSVPGKLTDLSKTYINSSALRCQGHLACPKHIKTWAFCIVRASTVRSKPSCEASRHDPCPDTRKSSFRGSARKGILRTKEAWIEMSYYCVRNKIYNWIYYDKFNCLLPTIPFYLHINLFIQKSGRQKLFCWSKSSTFCWSRSDKVYLRPQSICKSSQSVPKWQNKYLHISAKR